ncbi:hypothetical protein Tco_0851353 [Tanacetum coccineum]
MAKLPDDAIGVYHRMFDFSGVRIPFSLFLLALIKHYKIEPALTLFKVFKTLCKQGHWFSFAKCRAPSLVCIDDNRYCMKHWKSDFFLIDRRAIPDYMDMPEGVLVLSGLSRIWKSQTCDPVFRGAYGNGTWGGLLTVFVEPHHDIRPTLQRLPFYCTPPATVDVVIPEPTPEDLAASNPSDKVVAKAETSHKRKASTFGATSSHVAKRTRSAMAQSSSSTTRPNLFDDDSGVESDDDDDACYEIPLVTLIRSATVIPSSANQGGGSAAPAIEGPNTRDSRGKGIMTDADVAPSASVSRARSSSSPASSFRDVSGDAIHREFFPFSPGPYYATYPEGGIIRNYKFTREEWDAPH